MQRSVTIAANRNIAIFGDSVTLSGATSTKKAGETVTVYSRPAGEPVSRTDVTTTTNGAWSLRVQPRIQTQYQVQYGTIQSSQVLVAVRPRITFQKVGADKFLIVVLDQVARGEHRAADALRSRQRLAAARRRGTRQHCPDRLDRRQDRTALVPGGTKLRAVMSDDQTGPNYIDAHSNFIVK